MSNVFKRFLNYRILLKLARNMPINIMTAEVGGIDHHVGNKFGFERDIKRRIVFDARAILSQHVEQGSQYLPLRMASFLEFDESRVSMATEGPSILWKLFIAHPGVRTETLAKPEATEMKFGPRVSKTLDVGTTEDTEAILDAIITLEG